MKTRQSRGIPMGRLWWHILCVVSLFALLVGPESPVQAGAARSPASVETQAPVGPPPVPECYYTGSGYGSCEGFTIPKPGSVVTLTMPDKDSVFKLTGPAPLQSATPVACGDAGCTYNHLDWVLGGNAVKGNDSTCATDTSTCDVTLTLGGGGWTPVFVRQNTETPLLYLLWRPPTASLSVSVVAVAAPGGLPVGRPMYVAVSVTAGGGDVTGVTVSLVSSSAAIVVIGPASPASGFSLSGGQSRTVMFQTRTAQEGTATLSARATGTSAAGDSLSATAAAILRVGPIGNGISGTVYGEQCGATCDQAGLSGITVWVTGKDDHGSVVSKSAVTDANGQWSVAVPDGTYEAGPSEDGRTFGGLGYDPASVPNIAIHGSTRTNVDFATCVIVGDSISSAVDRPPLAIDRVPFATTASASSVARAPLATDRVPFATTASASSVNQCTSVYTVTLGGDIPQYMLVDPGEGARYNQNNDTSPDYRFSTGWWGTFKQVFNFILPTRGLEYPACFTHSEVVALANKGLHGADIRWYSYIRGPAKLSPVTVKFAYNQSTGQVTLLGDPVNDLSEAQITRVWYWREYQSLGTYPVDSGTCDQTSEIPALAFPVPEEHGFTIVVAWGFPFSGSGAQTSLTLDKAEFLEVAEKAGVAQDKNIATYWDHAAYDGKFALQLALMAAAVSGGLKLLELGAESAAVRQWVSEQFAKSAGKFAGLAERAHQAKDVVEVTEWLNAFSNEQGYMMAVIRGQFEPVFSKKGVHVATILALSQATTKFPNISISISRQAFAYHDDRFPAFSGSLPWRNSPLGTTKPASPAVSNPLAGNPTGFLVVNDESYASGTAALKALREATDESLSQVTYSINTHGNLAWNFLNEQREAGVAPPECKPTLPGDAISQGDDPNTICWRFNDGDA